MDVGQAERMDRHLKKYCKCTPQLNFDIPGNHDEVLYKEELFKAVSDFTVYVNDKIKAERIKIIPREFPRVRVDIPIKTTTISE